VAIEPNIKSIKNDCIQLVDVEYALQNVHVAVMLVDHREFKKSPKPDTKYIVDLKGVWQ